MNPPERPSRPLRAVPSGGYVAVTLNSGEKAVIRQALLMAQRKDVKANGEAHSCSVAANPYCYRCTLREALNLISR